MLSFDGEQLHLLMYLCHGADFNTPTALGSMLC